MKTSCAPAGVDEVSEFPNLCALSANSTEALKKTYIDPLEQDHCRDTLEELQYLKAQGMESFGDAFLDLAEEIKDTSTPADLIHIFKKAIPDPICLEVNKKAPSTLEEAVEAACIAAETLEGRGGNRKRHAQTGGSRANGKYQEEVRVKCSQTAAAVRKKAMGSFGTAETRV
uniref:Uncharacterized protein n=1 Tax=Chromera velia CCMP2878 TaxID=1169474 RepID=A0A0G4GDZ0_9ALVE|eukprot:Cvel_4557.t1-p1 / transcript=Cvel_4557.t1 / gene=Cvel_4557 / organism=Chromera_velia_CCMP2878 / gene_product=hypothetical protein / transcript_product=hypothetical protein / location=Cvel_scaffold200:16759-20814(+) / protein_length=171 / sequence_SO=supercontig / SO=protein_coding / is_pseudo=false